MRNHFALVITTINSPSESVKRLAEIAGKWNVIVVGDKKTPAVWSCPGVNFVSVESQLVLDLALASKCRFNSYTRKNLGYLLAMAQGAQVIAETDDDNTPYCDFLTDVNSDVSARLVTSKGWVNIYTLFTPIRIWPRGFPLSDIIHSYEKALECAEPTMHHCAVRQFLADGDPDVDAIYRLTQSGEVLFATGSYVLDAGTYCPFNSQNTVWSEEAFHLMYLPGFVTFRMTDIWRSLIAQVCLHAVGGKVAFHGPTVYQHRNSHALLRDFADEVPGYLRNEEILDALCSVKLAADPARTADNLLACYEKLISLNIVSKDELPLLEAWSADIARINAAKRLTALAKAKGSSA
jgi:hypothetical protein